jgi:hypothetical protein
MNNVINGIVMVALNYYNKKMNKNVHVRSDHIDYLFGPVLLLNN